MNITLEELMKLPHSLNTYIVVRNYLVETNDYNAYVYIIQNYIDDIPGIEIFKLMDQASKSFDEKKMEALDVVLFASVIAQSIADLARELRDEIQYNFYVLI